MSGQLANGFVDARELRSCCMYEVVDLAHPTSRFACTRTDHHAHYAHWRHQNRGQRPLKSMDHFLVRGEAWGLWRAKVELNEGRWSGR